MVHEKIGRSVKSLCFMVFGAGADQGILTAGVTATLAKE